VTEGMNSYGVTRHRHGKFILLGISLSSIVDSRLTEWIRFF
jgi:hypothetical protein